MIYRPSDFNSPMTKLNVLQNYTMQHSAVQYKIVHITIRCVLHICIVNQIFYAAHNSVSFIIQGIMLFYAVYHTMLYIIQCCGIYRTLDNGTPALCSVSSFDL